MFSLRLPSHPNPFRPISVGFLSKVFASDCSEDFDPFLDDFPFPIILRSESCKRANAKVVLAWKSHLDEFHGTDYFLALFGLRKLSEGHLLLPLFLPSNSRVGFNDGLTWVVHNLIIL